MRRVLLAVLTAAGATWGLAEEAGAFHHVIRARCIAYYPGLYSFGYCGAPCPPPPYTFPCTYSYPKYCGPFARCYDGRVYCSTGYRRCGLCCGLSCRLGCCLRGCAPCGYGCGYSCGGCCGCGSCGTCDSCGAGGGCENCDAGSSTATTEMGRTFQTNEKVLYDGPADKAPASSVPPQPEPDPSAGIFRRPFRLTSLKSQDRDGTNDFTRGMRAYWDDNMTLALDAFEAATAAEPQNALYRYYQALAMYNLQGPEAASQFLAQAVEFERENPIANWGRRMERVQGRARIWVEQARSAANVGG